MNSGQQKLQMNVNLSIAENVLCEKCDSDVFSEGIVIKRVSPLLSPTGKEVILPIKIFLCIQCGHIDSTFDEYRSKNTPKKENNA